MANNNLSAPDPYQSTGTTPGVSATNTTAAAVDNPYSSTPLPQQNIPIQTYVNGSTDPAIPVSAGPDLYTQDFAQIPAVYSRANVYLTQVQENVTQHTTVVQGGDYGNANVSAFLATNTGNIAAGYFLGDGSQLTGISALGNFIVNGSSKVDVVTPGGNVVVGADGNEWTFGLDGNLTLPDIASPSINYANGQPYGGSSAAAGNAGDIQLNVAGNIGADSTLRYVDNGGEMTLYADYLNAPGIFTSDISAGDGTPSNLTLTTSYGNATWTFGTDGYLTMPLVTKLNSGGIGNTNSAEFGTEVTSNGTAITGSQIYMGAGTTEIRGIVDSAGAGLMYAGVEGEGFAGIVGMDPGVTSSYAITVGTGNTILLGATQPGGTLTTTEYTAGVGALNANGTINGLLASSSNVVISNGNTAGWSFGAGSKITLPFGASLNDTSGESVAFGQNAGLTSQDRHAVAVGGSAGSQYQGEDSIAIGYQAGNHDQRRGVAIGYQAGVGGTLYKSVNTFHGGSGPVTTYSDSAPPNSSRLYVASTTNIEVNQRVFGNNIQANTVVTDVISGEDRVDISLSYTAAMSSGDTLTFVGLVIGLDNSTNVTYGMRVIGTDIPANTFVQSTGCSTVTLNQYPTAPLVEPNGLQFDIGQGAYSTAVGYRAGSSFQDDGAVAIGYQAGSQNQSTRAVAVGEFAGYSNQSANAVAVGESAGEFTQGINAVAVGYKAGQNTQGARAVAIGEDAGYNTQGEDAVAVGQKAGFASQGQMAIAIGNTAGYSGQTQEAVAIGYGTGLNSQQYAAVAIGANAASYNQGSTAVAVGRLAGNTSQGSSAVAVGDSAGYNYQSGSAVAVGTQSGYNYQSQYAVAIGSAAGQGQGYSAVYQSGTGTAITITPNADIKIGQRITGLYVPADTYVVDIVGASLTLSQAIIGTPAVDTVWTAWGQQGISAVAIGQNAALDFQGNNAVAIGTTAGQASQGTYGVAVGAFAGQSGQGSQAVAIGASAGAVNQGVFAVAIGAAAGAAGNSAVAIGVSSGFSNQGNFAVAIGASAGATNQGNNSIIINATGSILDQTTANTFTVAPVRNDVANIAEVMFYNATSKEVTYGNSISTTGNINAGNIITGTGTTGNITGANVISANTFIGNGSQLTGISTRTTGNWTLAPGVNTVSLTVPTNGTYSIWVNGNIPNGIVTYTATAVVTNNNVPVLGSSYAWYYAAGNALVLTSIPTQFVGTVNNISNAVVVTTTANVFTFGITNNSGANAVVNWGYTKL